MAAQRMKRFEQQKNTQSMIHADIHLLDQRAVTNTERNNSVEHFVQNTASTPNITALQSTRLSHRSAFGTNL